MVAAVPAAMKQVNMRSAKQRRQSSVASRDNGERRLPKCHDVSTVMPHTTSFTIAIVVFPLSKRKLNDLLPLLGFLQPSLDDYGSSLGAAWFHGHVAQLAPLSVGVPKFPLLANH